MIQNFANDNAEQVFLGYAPLLGSDDESGVLDVLTADLRFLDAVTTERDILALFVERVDSIEDVSGGKRVSIVEPRSSRYPFRIVFVLRSGDVFDLTVTLA